MRRLHPACVERHVAAHRVFLCIPRLGERLICIPAAEHCAGLRGRHDFANDAASLHGNGLQLCAAAGLKANLLLAQQSQQNQQQNNKQQNQQENKAQNKRNKLNEE